jgi:hypothetical protein
MINRSYTWTNENVEHSEEDGIRAAALAQKWSYLKTQEEEEGFRRQAAIEDGDEPYFDTEEEMKEWESRRKAARAERDLEIELVEDKLERLGARLMRPYEHWNEDEQAMAWAERDRD